MIDDLREVTINGFKINPTFLFGNSVLIGSIL
jgi:hypothetical protein